MTYLKDVKLIYTNDWWDGPLSGLVEYDGHHFFMDLHDELSDFDEDGDSVENRVYALYSLTAEQLRDQMMWMQFFRSHVGEHWDFCLNEGPALWGGFVSPDTLDTFYFVAELQEPRLSYDEENLFGYVHEDDLKRCSGRGNDRVLKMSEVNVCPLHHRSSRFRETPVVSGYCPSCESKHGDPYYWKASVKCRIINDLDENTE